MKYGEATLGQVEAVWNKLGGQYGVLQFLAGNVDVVIKDHIVNCDANPFIPQGWKVESHQKWGEFTFFRNGDDLWLNNKRTRFLLPHLFHSKKIGFFLSDKQNNGGHDGKDLHSDLTDISVLNVCHLDYLIANPELIPESWKVDAKGRTRYIFFWGTTYRCFSGRSTVRCLFWKDCRWRWSDRWLSRTWGVCHPAAVFAS